MGFPFGIASGDVTSSSVVLWARTDHGPHEVRWEATRQVDGFVLEGLADVDEEGFVHVELRDLRPGERWTYRFMDREGASGRGRFRTLPEQGPVRFAVVSCAKYNSGFFNAYEAVAKREDLDFVLHLGDYIYEAGQVPRGSQTPGADIGRPFEPLHDCVTEADYNARYAQYRRDPALQALHAAHGVIFTLDDHEIADNAWAGGSPEHFPTDGPWEARLRRALTAWERWQPTNRRPSRGAPVWQTVRLGGGATLFLCDSRLARTDPSAPDGPGKSVLGGVQRAALEQVAASCTDPWLIIGMPSKMLSLNPTRSDPETELVMRTLKLSDPSGGPYPDRWDSFAYERDEVVRELEASSSAPVLLCGDVHFASFSQTGSGRVSECVTASVTSPNFDDKMGWPPGAASRPFEAKLTAGVSELEWCDLDRHGYLIVEVSEARFVCEWWAVSTVLESTFATELLFRKDIARASVPQ